MVKIAGSFLKIQDNISKIKDLDEVCDYIHFDIMDGKFTEKPTLSVDQMCEDIKGLRKPIDVHLMVNDIKKYVDKVISINPSFITFHLEASHNVSEIISYIKDKGVKVGIAINPNTKVEDVYPYLNDIDMVLVMSVKAGASGQTFIDITDKVKNLIEYRDGNNLSYLIEVDGGINDATIKKVKNVDIVVVGSFITDSENYQSQIYKLKKSLRNGFTLAELLGVIIVLSILGLVAVTTIDNNIKKSRYDSCLVQETNLIEGAKMMMVDYPNLLPTSSASPVTVTVRQLQDGGMVNGQIVDKGYIDDNLVNPMTEKPYVDSTSGVSVQITTTNGSDYSYDVIYGNADEACHR